MVIKFLSVVVKFLSVVVKFLSEVVKFLSEVVSNFCVVVSRGFLGNYLVFEVLGKCCNWLNNSELILNYIGWAPGCLCLAYTSKYAIKSKFLSFSVFQNEKIYYSTVLLK